jgi:DedD protein
VAELTHDAADDGFHEIQLSGKQLAFLVMMTLSGLVLTFLLGVQVGRGVRAERGEDPIDAAPAASTAAADTGSIPSEPPAPPSENPQLTYPDRLKGEKSSESLTPRPEEAAKPEPPQPEPAPAAATSTATPPPAAPATAVRKPEPAATSVPKVPTSGKAGRWVVQVISLKNGAGAADITQRLIAKGYPAFMVPPGGTTPLYRVQIGRYNDRNEADRVARRLSREEDFRPEVKR